MNRIAGTLPLIIVTAAVMLHDTPQAAAQNIRNERLKIIADDGGQGDSFGHSVAISGPTAIVGAPEDNDNGSRSGSAYLFRVATGTQIAKLLPHDGVFNDAFGYSVAISGTTAIVGATRNDGPGEPNSGSAYLFDIADPVNPVESAKLRASDGKRSDNFGFSVAISESTAIVGAWLDDNLRGTDAGSAHLFDATSGKPLASLFPSDRGGQQRFGVSVAISGTNALVGVYQDDDNGVGSGSAYLYDLTAGRQIAKLLPADGAGGDQFGWSVAINESIAIVGAWEDVVNGAETGSAYLFDAAVGSQIAKLLSDDGAEGDLFGTSVAIGRSTALVGAMGDDDNGSVSGSAYLFDVTTGAQIA